MISRLQFLTLLMLFVLGSCEQSDVSKEPTLLTGRTMGTTYQVKFVSPDQPFDSETLHQRINGILNEIDQNMSTYSGDSELMVFNQYSGTDWYDISNETREVIDKAIIISELSNGALDITIGGLVELWGFGWRQTDDRIPTESEIKQLIKTVNYREIKTREYPSSIRKLKPQITIDLSSTAKGYAVDQVTEYLESTGIKNYLVEIGGEMRLGGVKDVGKPWKVAIEKPISKEPSIQQVVSFEGKGMATSGDYRNYFKKEGIRYSHTLDPRTGKPIVHDLASVSVITDSCIAADAWATAFMVLGVNEGMKLAKRLKLAVYFVTRDGGDFVVEMTPEFEPYLLEL
ncbi:MAG: FAD:protein FMN transferase [Proteobacteria bacterium]|nr:FAD:protein FMN transferase [Pseudomonadota bacterium]